MKKALDYAEKLRADMGGTDVI